MSILASYIVPHPPLAIAAIGQGEEAAIEKTLAAYRRVAQAIADHEPETIVFLNPHSAYYNDQIFLDGGSSARGDLAQFNAPEVHFQVVYDEELRERLAEEAADYQIPAGVSGDRSQPLDHGLIVPLDFISQRLPVESFDVVSVGGSGLDRPTLVEFGACIARAAYDLERRVVIVASGDLSHKLLEEGPYGYDPAGPKFDQIFCEVVQSGSPMGFARIDEALAQRAAECGLSGFVMMAGAIEEASTLNETRFESELLSYEGPFGVGYGVAAYEPI